MGFVSNLDLLVREFYDIPDDEETQVYCEKNGMDYPEELMKARRRDMNRTYIYRGENK